MNRDEARKTIKFAVYALEEMGGGDQPIDTPTLNEMSERITELVVAMTYYRSEHPTHWMPLPEPP